MSSKEGVPPSESVKEPFVHTQKILAKPKNQLLRNPEIHIGCKMKNSIKFTLYTKNDKNVEQY